MFPISENIKILYLISAMTRKNTAGYLVSHSAFKRELGSHWLSPPVLHSALTVDRSCDFEHNGTRTFSLWTINTTVRLGWRRQPSCHGT